MRFSVRQVIKSPISVKRWKLLYKKVKMLHKCTKKSYKYGNYRKNEYFCPILCLYNDYL